MSAVRRLIKKYVAEDSILRVKSIYYRIFGRNQIKGRHRNSLKINNAILKNCYIDFHGRNNEIVFGGGNRLSNCKIQIFGNNCQLIIGENNCFIDSIFWLEDNNSAIIIGNLNNFCGKVHMGIVEGTTLTIGNDCLMSSDIYITTTDSHSIIDIKSGQRINPSKDIFISDHVWIGHRVTIGKGVSIASDCIIGGSSYVTKSISKPHVIVAGVPAKVIKENITWDITRI